MSSESPSTTSGPPPASSWATPPEFYLDENSVSRSVRKLLAGLGYPVHTPAELFGSRDEALGAPDERWLPLVGQRGWLVIACDIRIFERPHEYEAYLRARVAVFLLSGESRIEKRKELIARNLSGMCSEASQRRSGVWRLTVNGLVPYAAPAAKRKRAQRSKNIGCAPYSDMIVMAVEKVQPPERCSSSPHTGGLRSDGSSVPQS
ncbi:hypothetical protein ACFYSC_12060 [Streptosporangium sp. NPDC004379]|uniref:PIN-like domain-containing protein n=1 Tax=Streptosporangium sp. NPDC004379 TaxID=3366189 RepID=UPI0036C9F319